MALWSPSSPLAKGDKSHFFSTLTASLKHHLPSLLPKKAVILDLVVCLSPRPIDKNKMKRNPAAKEIIFLFFRKHSEREGLVSPRLMEVLSISNLSAMTRLLGNCWLLLKIVLNSFIYLLTRENSVSVPDVSSGVATQKFTQ